MGIVSDVNLVAPTYSAKVFAAKRYRLSTLTVHDDSLVIVLKGAKGLHTPDMLLTAHTHEGVMIARGTQWDVVNDPKGELQYEALVLSFSDALIRQFNQAHPAGDVTVVKHANVLKVGDSLRMAMQRVLPPEQGQPVLPSVVFEHRAMEVLLLLSLQGFRFSAAESLGWGDKVRRMVAQRPHADWSVGMLCELFHTTESTLRRRLKSSDTTLAALVREVRLEVALGMLQTTSYQVGEVAQRCGWDSHSRFSAAFQTRWGVSPSVVRSRMNETAQNLTEKG
jgi:AraC-like DNA-binding protein